MWDARKLLVATVVFTAVLYRLAAQDTKVLDAASNAVDYLYDKCSEEAKRKLDSDLEKELNQSGVEFNTAWKQGCNCSEQVPGGNKKQITALSAYVKAGFSFQNTFNNEVETKGVDVNTYENGFNFKSLHYLLMSSMEMHRNNCMTVYAFIGDYQPDKKNGPEVRLGRFVMAEKRFADTTAFASEGSVILNITSCFFVNLRGKTCNSKSENALLLSPAEVFTVERTYTLDDENNDYTVIVLKHSGLRERYSCTLASKSRGVNVSFSIFVMLLCLSRAVFA